MADVRMPHLIFRYIRESEREERQIARILVSPRGLPGSPLTHAWHPPDRVPEPSDSITEEILVHPADWAALRMDPLAREHLSFELAEFMGIPVEYQDG